MNKTSNRRLRMNPVTATKESPNQSKIDDAAQASIQQKQPDVPEDKIAAPGPNSSVKASLPIEFPQNYYIRFKFFPPSFDGKYHICDNLGRLIGFFRLKAFKLKSEIHVFKDTSMVKEIMHIKSRNAIAFSAAYDISNPETGEVYGVWRRNGLQSLIVDSWSLCSPENENKIIGRIDEDSVGMALLRRYKLTRGIVGIFWPKSYRVLSQDGKLLATFKRSRNPFIEKLYVKIVERDMLELVAAGAILLVSAGNEKHSLTAINAKF